jgi:DNA processing protein
VLAGALDHIYPPTNADLYHRIRASGTILSEFPFGKTVDRQCFAIRNRIITGMAAATIVVESPEDGGSMLSAGFALRQGRPLFAIPGRLNDPCSGGCHRLIREGAHLFTCIDDVLAVLDNGTAVRRSSTKISQCAPVEQLSFLDSEQEMWQALTSRSGGATAEELANAVGMDSVECAHFLQDLYIRGIVRRELSGAFVPR